MEYQNLYAAMTDALLHEAHPSQFFEALRTNGQIHAFPELEALIGVEQEPRFHPEGDVWNHTMLVLDTAAEMKDQSTFPLAFLLSALCHDLGKPLTTTRENGRIRSIGHEAAGIPLARQLVQRAWDDPPLMNYVLSMVEMHMRPNLLAGQNSGAKAFRKVFDRVPSPEDLLLLSKADRMGQLRNEEAQKTALFLQKKLIEYRNQANT